MTLHTIAAFDRIGEENAFAVLARATALAAQGKDIINLGIGQPDFRTPEHIVEAAIKALRDGHHGYTPATGLLATREAVVRRTLTTTGVEVSPENVMILPGGKPTMYAAIIMFGEPGAEILYPDPGFPIYRSMIEFTGATPIPVPIREENGFAFSAEETLALITPHTRLLILNSPANPTGGVTPRAEIEKLVKGLETHPHVAILSDEIYDVMTYDGEEHCSLLQFPGNPRPADRAERLVEDLGDDRLAHGLVDLAERPGERQPLRQGAQARGELLVLRQRARPICRHRRDRRAAGRGGQDDDGLRPPPQGGGRRAERAARRFVHHAEGRVLRLPQHRRDRLEGEEAGLRAAGGRRRGADRRAGFRRSRRRLHPPFLRQFRRKYFPGAGARGRVSGEGCCVVDPVRAPAELDCRILSSALSHSLVAHFPGNQ